MDISNTLYLNNINNYKIKFSNNFKMFYICKYIDIVHFFLLSIKSNEYLKSKSKFELCDIITRGLTMFCNCYNTILMYTRNIETAYFDTKTAIILYIEFIVQVSQETCELLEHENIEEVLFIYKKIICNIPSSIKNNYNCSNTELIFTNDILKVCRMYNYMISIVIKYNIDEIHNMDYIHDIIISNEKIIQNYLLDDFDFDIKLFYIITDEIDTIIKNEIPINSAYKLIEGNIKSFLNL